MDASLLRKLDPQRFPNMSLPMAAILGFVLERQYTTPALADVQVTPDGHVLGWPSEEEGVGHSMHLGVEADLRANLSRLGMAAGLDQEEWIRFAAMVRSRLGIELGELAAGGEAAREGGVLGAQRSSARDPLPSVAAFARPRGRARFDLTLRSVGVDYLSPPLAFSRRWRCRLIAHHRGATTRLRRLVDS